MQLLKSVKSISLLNWLFNEEQTLRMLISSFRTLRLNRISCFAILLLSTPLVVHSQTTDAAAKVQALIASYENIPYTHLVSKETTRIECDTTPQHPDPDRAHCGPVRVFVNVPETDNVTPSPLNIRIISATEPQWDQVVITSLPDKITAYGQELINCLIQPLKNRFHCPSPFNSRVVPLSVNL